MTPRPKQVSRLQFTYDPEKNQRIRDLCGTIYSSQDDEVIRTAMDTLAKLELGIGKPPLAVLFDLETMRPGRTMPTGQILREAAEALGMGCTQ